MKGDIRYAIACVFGSYTKSSPAFHISFASVYKPATMLLEVFQEEREKIAGIYPYYPPEWRAIWRRSFSKTVRVLEIGNTYIQVGYRRWYGDEEGNRFFSKSQLKVCRVVPFPENDERYYKPFEVLTLDLKHDKTSAMKALQGDK